MSKWSATSLGALTGSSTVADISAAWEAVKSELNSADSFVSMTEYLTSESVPLTVSQSILVNMAQWLQSKYKDDDEFVLGVTSRVLPHLATRPVSFDSLMTRFLLLESESFSSLERPSDAAASLMRIPLDTGLRSVPDRFRLLTLLRAAELYCEDDDTAKAEQVVSKLTSVMSSSPEGDAVWESGGEADVMFGRCATAEMETAGMVRMRYAVVMAHLLDARRKFMDAAGKYYELSKTLPEEEQRLQALGYSATCAILAAAGPRRSRLLAVLYKDDRSRPLKTYAMLECMYLGKIVAKADADAFAAQLRPHQMATTGDGTTILERAILEHNALSASQFYDNISFAGLGALLGIPADQAEDVASRMIVDGRLHGKIDQIEEIIVFRDEPTETWDKRIEAVCSEINSIAEAL